MYVGYCNAGMLVCFKSKEANVCSVVCFHSQTLFVKKNDLRVAGMRVKRKRKRHLSCKDASRKPRINSATHKRNCKHLNTGRQNNLQTVLRI